MYIITYYVISSHIFPISKSLHGQVNDAPPTLRVRSPWSSLNMMDFTMKHRASMGDSWVYDGI